MTLEKEPNHEEDIKKYINSCLEVDDDVDSDLLEQIKTQILDKSCGIFLWVNLVVHQLNEVEIQPDRMDVVWQHLRDIPRAAKETPAYGEAMPLYGLFKDIINKDAKGTEKLVRLAQIIFRAKRPLRPKELYVALHGCYENPFESYEISDQMIMKNVLRSSKGLAEVTQSEQPTVQFIHETVNDFLRDDGLRTMFTEQTDVDGHEALKTSCLQQLHAPVAKHLKLLAKYQAQSNYWRRTTTSQQANKLTTEQQKDFQKQASIKFPFLEYASQNLLFHANEAETLGISQQNFIRRFPSAQWIPIHNLFEKYHTRRYKGVETQVLYILAGHGCNSLIKLCPNSGSGDCVQKIKGEEFPSVLACAISTGHLGTAYTLVGLDPRILYHNTASLRLRRTDFVKSDSLLETLVAFGDPQLLRKLLDNGICRNEGPVEWDQIISADMLDLLIEFSLLPDFSPETNPREGQESRLPHANLPFLRQAIEQNPSLVTTPDRAGQTILDHICSKELRRSTKGGVFTSLVSIYVEYARGDQDRIDDLLRLSVSHNNLYWARVALLHGADVNAQDARGRTALHVTARGCQSYGSDDCDELLDLFSQEEVDWSIRDSNGLAAMDLAFSNHVHLNSEVAGCFVRAGADPNTLVRCRSCEDHQVPVIIASYLSGLRGTWTELVSNQQCDLDRRDNLGRTALSWCFGHQHEKPTWNGFTSRVFWQSGRSDLLRTLSVDINSRDDARCIVLEHFIRHPRPSQGEDFTIFVAEFFRSERLDPNLITSNGQSPLELIISLFDTWPAEFGDMNTEWNVNSEPGFSSGGSFWYSKDQDYIRGSERQEEFSAHLIRALKLLLGTKRVDLKTQRECLSRAPPALRSIISDSLAECGVMVDHSRSEDAATVEVEVDLRDDVRADGGV